MTKFAVAFLVVAAFAIALPAADDPVDEAIKAIRQAKTKQERLAVLKGKDGFFLEDVLFKLWQDHTPLAEKGEFKELELNQSWTEEIVELMPKGDRQKLCKALCLLGKGRNHQVQEQFDEAAATYKELLTLVQTPELKPLELAVLSNLGAMQSSQGNFVGGVQTLEKAKAGLVGQDALARQVMEAKILGNLGLLYSDVGDYPQAERELKESLRLAEKAGDALAALNARINLARLDLGRGEYREAIRAYEAAVVLCRKAGLKVMEGQVLNNLGLALSEEGRISIAIERFEQARKVAVGLKHRRGEAMALANLALVHYQLAQDDDAIRYNKEALKLFQAVGDKAGIARCLKLSAIRLPLDAARQQEADKLFAECMELVKAGGSKAALAEMMMYVGLQFEGAGQLEKAEEAYAVSAKAYKELGDPRRHLLVRIQGASMRGPVPGSVLVDLAEFRQLQLEVDRLDDPRVTSYYYGIRGELYLHHKLWAESADFIRIAIKASEREIGGINAPELIASFASEQGRHDLPTLYSHLVAAEVGRGDYLAAFAAAERAKARALTSVLARGGRSIHKQMTAKEQEDDAVLRAAVSRTSHESESIRKFATDDQRRLQIQKNKANAEAEYEAFRRRLFTAHPQLRVQQGDLPDVDLVTLQKTVFANDPDLAILSYVVSYDRVSIIAVTAADKPDGPAKVTVRTKIVGEKELSQAAERFWDGCKAAGGAIPNSKDLWKWLIAPVEKDLVGKKHLLIVPSSPLLNLPFHALRDEDEPYLIEQYSVSYAPSVSALLEMRRKGDQLREQARADRPVLAVGGVNFTSDLPELPASGPEAEEVGKIFGERARVVLGKNATRTEIMRLAPSTKILHFATHGIVNAPRPLFSALAVTQEGAEDDGRLYAHDVMNLDLSADLAVLSACDTARGREFRGEGTLGLAWAFFVAGVPTVVVSQWSVSDRATERLMREFHSRIKAKTDSSRRVALQQAQLTLLKDKKTKHPFFWAPFVLIGDWRN